VPPCLGESFLHLFPEKVAADGRVLQRPLLPALLLGLDLEASVRKLVTSTVTAPKPSTRKKHRIGNSNTKN
jgi:hypothetical protein